MFKTIGTKKWWSLLSTKNTPIIILSFLMITVMMAMQNKPWSLWTKSLSPTKGLCMSKIYKENLPPITLSTLHIHIAEKMIFSCYWTAMMSSLAHKYLNFIMRYIRRIRISGWATAHTSPIILAMENQSLSTTGWIQLMEKEGSDTIWVQLELGTPNSSGRSPWLIISSKMEPGSIPCMMMPCNTLFTNWLEMSAWNTIQKLPTCTTGIMETMMIRAKKRRSIGGILRLK